MRKDKWVLYNDLMTRVWKDYDHQTSLIGKSVLVPKKKFFGLKITQVEKILSDAWIECSYDVVDKDNVISKYKNPRIREFSDYSEVLDNLRKSLDKPGNVIKNFSITCEKSFIDPYKETNV